MNYIVTRLLLMRIAVLNCRFSVLVFIFLFSGISLGDFAQDHLEPVNRDEDKMYRSKLDSMLLVTPANFARMSLNPGSDPEFAVSVYSRSSKDASNRVEYYVTLTQASDSIWYSMPENNTSHTKKHIYVTRYDTEIPSSTALAIRRAWEQMLSQTRPHKGLVDPPIGGETVYFSIDEPRFAALAAQLPVQKGKNTQKFERLGLDLADYCKAPMKERQALAQKITRTAEELLKHIQ